ncbi:Protein roadkill like protein [Argiope bruennichi]|uniref:Protein roadkill like protein n=1 Tax=Argiope bruennichi TaxID=94029 RepID=A0A8T0G3Y8_ARGBR|nr:Protein roadkill like protein [Argiope bruennichi]
MKILILVISVIAGICTFTSIPEKFYTTLLIRNSCDRRYNDLADSMSNLLNSGAFSDFTIHVGGEKIRAHRAILAARSEFFSRMLLSGPDVNMNEIIVEEIPSKAVKAMLRFIYSGEIEMYAFKAPAELYVSAYIFKVPFLIKILHNILENSLNLDNAIELFILANKNGDVILEEKILEFMVKNVLYIEKRNDWMDFLKTHPVLANKVVLFLNKKYQ